MVISLHLEECLVLNLFLWRQWLSFEEVALYLYIDVYVCKC